LENSLVSVLENRPDDCEIVVVLDQPYDNPYELEDEVRFLAVPGAAGLVQCLNFGIHASRSAVIHVLGCGAEVSENWTAAAMQHFDNPQIAAVAPLLLDEPNEPRVRNAGLAYGRGGVRRQLDAGLPPSAVGTKSRDVLGPSVLAAFYRSEVLMTLGEMFDPAVGDQLADVDLALRLQKAGYRSVLEPKSLVYCQQASLPQATGWTLGRQVERLFWRNAPLAGWARSLAAHVATVAGETGRLLTSPGLLGQLAGRCAASLEIGHYLRHYRRLARLGVLAQEGSDPQEADSRRADRARPEGAGQQGVVGTRVAAPR
jgi:hypothetical protein